MAYVFLVLVLTFTGLTVGYLWKNDFAKETLDVLFPAVGAILLSLYLGLKSIWIDKPDEKRFSTTIAVLHDVENGIIRGMAPRSVRHLPRFAEFTGAQLIDTLPLYNDFKELNLSAVLKQKSETPGGPAESLVLDFVEYAFLQWLIAAEQRIGYIPSPKIELISSAGGGGGLSQQLNPMRLPKASSEPNILLRARPLSLSLPDGSSVSREATSSRRKLPFAHALQK